MPHAQIFLFTIIVIFLKQFNFQILYTNYQIVYVLTCQKKVKYRIPSPKHTFSISIQFHDVRL